MPRVVTALLCASVALAPLWARAQHTYSQPAATYDPRIPTPRALLGYNIGDRFTPHRTMMRYIERIAAASKRVKVDTVARTFEGPNMKLWDYPLAEWEQVMAINLNGVFLCCREVVPHMRERNYGRIVNIASVAGKDGNPNASAYSASKAAVIALTKSLGKELADTGVRVNCVTPAAVKTAMFDQMSAEHIAFMLSKIPMARFGTVEEVAAMVSWLSSEECSFSTGAVFDLSGGRSTY